jgi:hypothetical protein
MTAKQASVGVAFAVAITGAIGPLIFAARLLAGLIP